MNRSWFVALLAPVLLAAGPASRVQAADGIDLRLARQYFDEAEMLWRRDGGRLWGRPLNGPLLFVEQQTRRVAANQADAEGRLRKEGTVFVGELLPSITVANTTTRWAGVQWIMVLWPLPSDRDARRVLLMHESWHRVQQELGFPPTRPVNAHLDSLDGRYTIQLEWRALAEALAQRDPKRRAALEDALFFRAYRYQRFKEAAKEERLLEMHEGLAEYTGVKLSGLSEGEQAAYVVKQLKQRPQTMASFVRSFAYLSGPAYGLLLDAHAPEWLKGLTPDADLAARLQAALAIHLPEIGRDELKARAKRYGADKLLVEEQQREQERQKRLAEYRERFVRGPVLILPLQDLQVSYDPRTVQPLEGIGTVYPSLRIVDRWGCLTASKGALVTSDFKKVQLTAPTDPKARPLRGDGWEVQLNPGWRVQPGERKGDFHVKGDGKE
jgi:hypothetical protein